MSKKPILTITQNALDHLATLLQKKGDLTLTGFRITTPKKGCSGLKYQIDFTHKNHEDEDNIPLPFKEKPLKLFIDPSASFHLIGTVMDYRTSDLESGFTFKNPNAKGQCGCGESFYV